MPGVVSYDTNFAPSLIKIRKLVEKLMKGDNHTNIIIP
jgi:hypothetical protein